MSYLINKRVATQLKKARAEKGWSLDVASQFCGVSKAMLGQIERGESSPTIAKLWKIATGFALPLSYFLSDEEQLDKKNIEKEQSISIKTMFEFDKQTGIEVFEINLAVGHQQHSQAHQTGVIEYIIVNEGELEYFLEQKWVTLKCGDKAKFNADQVHIYRNIGKIPARFLNIIHYPRL